MKKLVISIIVIAVFSASFFIFSNTNNNDIEGEISILIIDEFGDTISELTHDFTEDDTVFSILNSNYTVGCADSHYNISTDCEAPLLGSRIILKIDSLETNWSMNYIGIYENDIYSSIGIDSLSLNDGDVYKFKYHNVGDDN